MTRAGYVGWNDSFEIGEKEISNLDSTALSKLTYYLLKNCFSDLFHYHKEMHVLMPAVNRKQSIENKSACGIGIPKLAYKMSGSLCFLGDWKLFTKSYGIFRVPANALWDS